MIPRRIVSGPEINYIQRYYQERSEMRITAMRSMNRPDVRYKGLCQQVIEDTISVRNYMRLRSHLNNRSVSNVLCT